MSKYVPELALAATTLAILAIALLVGIRQWAEGERATEHHTITSMDELWSAWQ